MNINGGTTCVYDFCISISGDTKIYPLPHMPVVKDLVADLTFLSTICFHKTLAAVEEGAT